MNENRAFILQAELNYRVDKIGECRAERNRFNFLSLNHYLIVR